eukprot:2996288-Alexandrium_andersonii.AAC.1
MLGGWVDGAAQDVGRARAAHDSALRAPAVAIAQTGLPGPGGPGLGPLARGQGPRESVQVHVRRVGWA